MNGVLNSRISWDNYFLEIAKTASLRSVCFRSQCGAVIVKDKAILSTGYNGAPCWQQNCLEIGFCYREKNNILSGTQLERCRAVGSHAESNAISLAAKNNGGVNKSTIYIYGNTAICSQCRAMIANSGIIRVVYKDKFNKITEIIPEEEWTTHDVDFVNTTVKGCK